MTVFLPGHRLERIELDESGGGIEGIADRFRRLTGHEPLARSCSAAPPAPHPSHRCSG